MKLVLTISMHEALCCVSYNRTTQGRTAVCMFLDCVHSRTVLVDLQRWGT